MVSWCFAKASLLPDQFGKGSHPSQAGCSGKGAPSYPHTMRHSRENRSPLLTLSSSVAAFHLHVCQSAGADRRWLKDSSNLSLKKSPVQEPGLNLL